MWLLFILEGPDMKRTAFFAAVVAAVSLIYPIAPFAQPAAQPGAASKAPATKTKAKAKEPDAHVEGSYASEAEAKRACADGTVSGRTPLRKSTMPAVRGTTARR